jgi:hypothetical protein
MPRGKTVMNKPAMNVEQTASPGNVKSAKGAARTAGRIRNCFAPPSVVREFLSSGQDQELRGRSRHEYFTSAQKTQAVLRLLRGEPAETLSEEFGISIRRLERWQEEFISGGRNALARRKDLSSNNWLGEHAVAIRQWFWLVLALGAVVSLLAKLLERGGE